MEEYIRRISILRDIASAWQQLYRTEKKDKQLLLKAIEKFNETRNHRDLSNMLEIWREMKDD